MNFLSFFFGISFSFAVYGTAFDPLDFYSGIEGNSKINCLSYAMNTKNEVSIRFSWWPPLHTPAGILNLIIEALNKHFPERNVRSLVRVEDVADGDYPIAFYMSHSADDSDGCLSDYHFVRRDIGRKWSHKIGKLRPEALASVVTPPDTLRYEFGDEPGELYVDYKLIGYFSSRISGITSRPSTEQLPEKTKPLTHPDASPDRP